MAADNPFLFLKGQGHYIKENNAQVTLAAAKWLKSGGKIPWRQVECVQRRNRSSWMTSNAVKAMKEAGIDISNQTSDKFDDPAKAHGTEEVFPKGPC